MTISRTVTVTIATLLTVLSAPAARAGDGVIEINQARALAGGVTPGDDPGFPVTISERGSYLLTGNLQAGSASGIEVNAPDVTIDLNGFKMAGNAGARAFGIQSGFVGVRVRNGVVQTFGNGDGGAGIDLDDAAIVENVRVTDSAAIGIKVGDNSQVRHCVVERHFFRGIWAGGNARLIGNTAVDNLIGMRADGGVVEGNTVVGDGDIGIEAEGGPTVVTNNAVQGTHDFGFALASRTGYSGNSASGATTNFRGGTEMGPNICETGLCP